jgi:hypothetical protein
MYTDILYERCTTRPDRKDPWVNYVAGMPVLSSPRIRNSYTCHGDTSQAS